MSKLDRKRKREKAKQNWQGVTLAPVPRQKARGAARMREIRDKPQHEVLNARCVRFGLAPNAKNRDIVRSPWMCCDLGFVIEARCGNAEAARLWDVFARWCRAEATYRARYLGQSEQPAAAALLMIPERMESDQSATVDLRTPDERDRDAVRAWMHWQGLLGHLSASQRTALQCARREDGPALWRDCAPTTAGGVALESLRALAEVEA